jgi:elongation factor G
VKVYESSKIRNIGLVGHGGSGKTSLVEALLFNSGGINRLGRVDEGNTTTDYLPEEIKRKMTINLAMAPVEWKDYKINLLDTPGYSDFIGDVKGVLRVADNLLFTVCAASGVEVQTEIIWNYAENKKIPKLFFINKLDRENADFNATYNQITTLFNSGKHIVPLQIPIGSEDNFKGVINLIEMCAYVYNGTTGKATKEEIPDEYKDEAETFRLSLIEAAAEGEDELLMKYLDGEELSEEEVRQGLKQGIKDAKVIPVLCGSALRNIGIDLILDFMINYLPSPQDLVTSIDSDKTSLLVFKTLADPYVGKISFVKIMNGNLKVDSQVINVNKDIEEKISQLFVMVGKNQNGVNELKTGDIATITKLQGTLTGDTLTYKNNKIQPLEGVDFPKACLTVAIQPKSKGDEDKLGSAIARLLEEDPTISIQKNIETKETLLKALGEIHVDIIMEKLQRKFGVEVKVSLPKVPYRETVKLSANKIEGKHKKQSGGHGQFGHVYIDLAPIKDKDFEFTETIFGGSVPKQYVPAVEKGIREAMTEGILAGFPVTNIKVTLTDGSYHPVDSSEMAFKIAATLALKKGMEKAKPILLEPIMRVSVTVPDHFMGDIIGDLNTKRGKILGMDPVEKKQIISALVPLSEMYRYAIDLKSITQGRGEFDMEFAQYDEVPQIFAEKIVELSKVAKTS